MTSKEQKYISRLRRILRELLAVAKSLTDHDKSMRETWQPAGKRRSFAGNLERAVQRAEAVLRKEKA